jgi:alpha-L-rhamnosidase
MTPTELTTEYTSEPIGLQTDRPALGWQFETDGRDQRQTAYRVIVATSSAQLSDGRGDLWDSGKVDSDRSVNVPYGGRALRSRQISWWKVRTWDADGQAGDWSAPASFEIGLLDGPDWRARWIGHRSAGENRHDLSPLLRQEFTVAGKVSRARAYFSGLGFGELYLNGEKVSDDVLSPVMADYHCEVTYVVHDVTRQVKPGGNAVGIWLGNGWYAAPIDILPKPWASSPVALLQIEIELADGSTQMICSDESWRTSPGPISLNTIDRGEYYDARLEKPGWYAPGYDDTDWRQVDLLEPPRGKLVARTLPEMKVMRRFPPTAITNPQNGVWVFHFDKLYSGWARLRTRGKAGQAVQLEYGSRLLPEGTIYKGSWPGDGERDRYTLKGDDGGENFEPRFTFHPMQYVQVTGLSEQPDEETLTGCHVYSDVPLAARFECANPLFNGIHGMTQQTVMNAMKGFLLDCMHREPIGYNEPASVSSALWSRHHLPRFWVKYSRDILLADGPSGFPSDIAPLLPYLYAEPRRPDVAQTTNYPMLVWNMYLLYDDLRLVEAHYPVVEKWLNTIASMCDDEKVVTQGWLGEHMVPGDAPGEEEFRSSATSPSFLWTCLYSRNASIAAQMAAVLGKDRDAREQRQLAAAIRDTVNEKWYDEDNASYDTGSQTANLLPLALGVVPEPEIPRVVQTIRSTIRDDDGGKMRVGHVGLPSLLETATRHGLGQLLYGIVNQSGYPGWGYMLAHGASTVWECWGVHDFKTYAAAESMTMLGGVARFFYDDLAGIRGPDFLGTRPFAPGYSKVTIAPHLLGDLAEASAAIETVRGTIRSAWRLSDGELALEVTVPPNTTGQVYIPCCGWTTIRLSESGRWIDVHAGAGEVPGIHAVERLGDVVRCDVGSGCYQFQIQPG